MRAERRQQRALALTLTLTLSLSLTFTFTLTLTRRAQRWEAELRRGLQRSDAGAVSREVTQVA